MNPAYQSATAAVAAAPAAGDFASRGSYGYGGYSAVAAGSGYPGYPANYSANYVATGYGYGYGGYERQGATSPGGGGIVGGLHHYAQQQQAYYAAQNAYGYAQPRASTEAYPTYDPNKFAKYDGRKRTAEESFDSGGDPPPNKMARGFGGGGGGYRDRGGFGSSSYHSGSSFRRYEPRDFYNRDPIDFNNVLTDKRFNFWNLPEKARVLLVSNLPSYLSKPNFLFNLFGAFGDVVRVKLVRKKKGVALVEFVTATFAMVARNHLDGLQLEEEEEEEGQKLVVSFSKFDRIRLQDDIVVDDCTQDYSGPEFERQRRFGNRTKQLRSSLSRVNLPNERLHVANLPAGTTELGAKALFATNGLQVEDLVLVDSEEREEGVCAVVDMGKLVEAVKAVGVMSGMLAEDGSPGLRISFSKTTVAEERAKLPIKSDS